ncbi:MAG: GxxExxY protein [Planctomycetota bacterium]|jgi:GxxExxY protein
MVATEDGLVHKDLTGQIIGAAMEVHSKLGSGFLESVYEGALAYEFELRKIIFEQQKEIPVFYKNKQVKLFVCDFVVDGRVIVELKAIKEITEIEKIQVINYLKAGGFPVGLLLNFGRKSLEYKRLVYTKN